MSIQMQVVCVDLSNIEWTYQIVMFKNTNELETDKKQNQIWHIQVQQRDDRASENNRDLRRCTQRIINPKKSFSLELSVKCLGKEGFNIVSPC